MSIRPSKTRISLGDQSLLCAQWVSKDPGFLRADAQADLSLRWVHSHFVGFVITFKHKVNLQETLLDPQKSDKSLLKVPDLHDYSVQLHFHCTGIAFKWYIPILQYYDTEFTLWDRFEIQGEMTMKELMDHFQVGWTFLAHLSRRLTRRAYSIPMVRRCRPHFQLEYLWSQLANLDQILWVASLG